MPPKQRILIALVFLVFLLAGCAAFGQLFALPMWHEWQARDWQPTRCTIIANKLDADDKFQFEFQYEVDGKRYSSDRHGFLVIGTEEFDLFRELISRYPAGSDATCYVNPDDPNDIVLDRDVPGRVWANSPLILFVLVGVAGLVWISGVFWKKPITDARMKKLCDDATAESLDIPDSLVTDAGLVHLRKMTSLKDIDLSGTQITDEGLRELRWLRGLEMIAINNLPITDRGVEYLAELKHVDCLALAGTEVTDRGLATLAKMTQLEMLSLGGTKITDDGLRLISSLSNLTWLELCETAITDDGLPSLYSLSKLEDLDLEGTATTAEGIKRLQTALPKCEITE